MKTPVESKLDDREILSFSYETPWVIEKVRFKDNSFFEKN